MQAEKTYGVSALYLVAHSIEESSWGTSSIAQNDDNLFGYGADDRDPAGDASSFPSFAACILYVAQQVKEKYLTPGVAGTRGGNGQVALGPFPAGCHRPDRKRLVTLAKGIPPPSSRASTRPGRQAYRQI